jgi:hypothetical protein
MRFVMYCRQAGVVSLALAVASMMLLPDGFIWFVLAVYLAIIVWGSDVVFREVRRFGLFAQLVAALPFAFAAVWFSSQFVWLRLPLNIWSRNPDADYPADTVIAGIKWSQKFADLRVTISNDSEYDYMDLNLVLKPKEPVLEAAQVSAVPDVSITRENPVQSFEVQELDNAARKRWELPAVWFASTGGFRIRCAKLPAHSNIEIVMALVDFNEARMKQAGDANYVAGPWKIGDDRYWWRLKDFIPTEDFFNARPLPDSVRAIGQFVAFHRRKHTTQTISVSRPFPEVIKHLGKPCCQPKDQASGEVIEVGGAVFAILVLSAPVVVLVLRLFGWTVS